MNLSPFDGSSVNTGWTRPEFLGVRFDNLTLWEAANLILRRPTDLPFTYVVTPNVDHLVKLNDTALPYSASFGLANQKAFLRLCDSRIVELLGKISGKHIQVTTGSDLTGELFDRFFEGSRVAVIGNRSDEIMLLRQKYPAINITHHRPPMGVLTNRCAQTDIIDFVESGGADFFIFAIGAPQSEIICKSIADRGRATGIGLCVGASIEFLIGAKRRAPKAFRRLRLEWLFRLLSEPRRLWRRYLFDGPQILRIWLKHRL